MTTQKINSFLIIGIAIRTSNENGQAANDIPLLWNKFMTEGIMEKIPNKIDYSIYCIYTDYEKDYTKPYTTILGCRVNNLDAIPAGMIGHTIAEGAYNKRTLNGNILQGLLINEWVKIWNSPISRAYTADFEVYGEKARDLENAEVDLYLAIK